MCINTSLCKSIWDLGARRHSGCATQAVWSLFGGGEEGVIVPYLHFKRSSFTFIVWEEDAAMILHRGAQRETLEDELSVTFRWQNILFRVLERVFTCRSQKEGHVHAGHLHLHTETEWHPSP